MAKKIAKYRVIERTRRGVKFGDLICLSIEALAADGRRVRLGRDAHFLATSRSFYRHYKSGVAKYERPEFERIKVKFESRCADLNNSIMSKFAQCQTQLGRD